jgi:hypothetical protein
MLAPSEAGVPLVVEPRLGEGVQAQSQCHRIGGAVILATDNLEGKLVGLQLAMGCVLHNIVLV